MTEYSPETDATSEEMGSLINFIGEVLARQDMDEEQRAKLYMAIDEAITNVIFYAYPNAKGKLRISITTEEKFITAEITDRGIPFDPTKVTPPNTALPLEQRESGGLGIHLIRKTVDVFRYSREDDVNRLTIAVKKRK